MLIILILIVLLLFGFGGNCYGGPVYAGGGIGLVLVILLILYLTGYLGRF